MMGDLGDHVRRNTQITAPVAELGPPRGEEARDEPQTPVPRERRKRRDGARTAPATATAGAATRDQAAAEAPTERGGAAATTAPGAPPLMRMRPASRQEDLGVSAAGAAVALGAGPDSARPAVGDGVRVDAAGRVLRGAPRRTAKAFGEEQAALATETLNREKGLAHPQLYDYARDARAIFKPDVAFMELIAGEPGYLDTVVDQYRGTEEKRATKHFNALVCVTITPGKAPAVAVRRSSESPRFDRLAVESLERAIDRRAIDEPLVPIGPIPTDSVVRACYSFDAKLSRIPPNVATLVGGGFEETTGEVNLVYWFKKMLNLAVHFEGVGYTRPSRQ